MSTQRSTWVPTWPSTAPETTPAGTSPVSSQTPKAPVPPPTRPAAPAQQGGVLGRPLPPTQPAPPASRPVAPTASVLGKPIPPAAPANPNLTPPAHLANNAVLADLARQARTARAELQAAQETFARRALGLYETLRVVDDSLVQLATHVLGNSVIAAAWFSSRNHHLSQRSPLEVLMVGDRELVVNELLRLEHGVY
ncbi:MbcA/ParS/Xre antitoxin family protein [Tahibacter amnicola]|uniref:MbcA/ParS/Xre antitoxin family protein n=1 Tax=Tahibacter amnicola TaxID=2976241 RepID=A0ABY6BFT8_9GAMM|nr:MbcA/ParS/Xre antitoxin family protein [Tahibacter amnicola]UXI68884.1 MbcA/ParS/Xre antitoxin family protein [Tahibacter amnicola]